MVPNIAIALAAFSVVSSAATTIDKRVIGGEDAKDGEFPFIVSLSGRGGQCSGSLLDSTTVLTAAHCLEGRFTSVRAGTLVNIPPFSSVKSLPLGCLAACVADTKLVNTELIITQNRRMGGVIADIAFAKEHPSYIKGHGDHDIAILKLSTPINRNETMGIGYAVLPENGSDPAPNSTATTAGW